MSNFSCPHCGMINVDCGKEGYKTQKEIEYEKALEEIEKYCSNAQDPCQEDWNREKENAAKQILDIIADLRTDETNCNPDNEQIEPAGAALHRRNYPSVEQIQDSKAKGEL